MIPATFVGDDVDLFEYTKMLHTACTAAHNLKTYRSVEGPPTAQWLVLQVKGVPANTCHQMCKGIIGKVSIKVVSHRHNVPNRNSGLGRYGTFITHICTYIHIYIYIHIHIYVHIYIYITFISHLQMQLHEHIHMIYMVSFIYEELQVRLVRKWQ